MRRNGYARLRGFEPVVWRIQVVPGILGLSRSRAGIKVGERVTLGANLLDDEGKVIGPAAGIQWASDRAEVAAPGDGAGGWLSRVASGATRVSGGGSPKRFGAKALRLESALPMH